MLWPVSTFGPDSPEFCMDFFNFGCDTGREVRAALFADQEQRSANDEIAYEDVDKPAVGGA